MKHAKGRSAEEEVVIDPAMSELRLAVAIQAYRELFGQMTPSMVAGMAWATDKNEYVRNGYYAVGVVVPAIDGHTLTQMTADLRRGDKTGWPPQLGQAFELDLS